MTAPSMPDAKPTRHGSQHITAVGTAYAQRASVAKMRLPSKHKVIAGTGICRDSPLRQNSKAVPQLPGKHS